MANSKRLTPVAIERTKAGDRDVWLSDDDGTRGGGRLVVRISKSGSKLFYYRYSVDGVRHQEPLRPFAPKPTEGCYTLEQARQVARHYSELHRRPESRNVGDYLRRQQAQAAEVERLAATKAEEVERAAANHAKHTVKALCDWYVEHLRRQGKPSAADVRGIFRKHLAPTEYADVPANMFTGQQATALLRRIVEAGKGRTATKLRSYLRAAYESALKGRLDASFPLELTEFEITYNPLASTASLSQFNRARDRVLSEVELGLVWRRLNRKDPVEAKTSELAIRLALLLGGQRIAQLLRVRLADVDMAAGRIKLYDQKGRRQKPRLHLLPLTAEALKLVEVLYARSCRIASPWLFASGKKVVVPKTISDASTEISKELLSERLLLEPFQCRDFRRTAETVLAALRVSKDIRAQIQSHGLGGVQDRHYDRHDYMDEKQEALAKWQDRLRALAYGNRTTRHSS